MQDNTSSVSNFLCLESLQSQANEILLVQAQNVPSLGSVEEP